MEKKNSFLKGAAILSLGGLIAKILGAFYRVPLTNLLGAEGIGVYQTAFPTYCVLLTFSSTGVPTAIAKLVSSGEDAEGVLRKCLKIFLPIGAVGTLFMAVFAYPISYLQGSPEATLSYLALSPSVFAVSAISCYRGYFQGKGIMKPTAISQITEQAVKLAVGLTLCYFIRISDGVSGALACLAVSLSEVFAALYLKRLYDKNKENSGENVKYYSVKSIFSIVFPVTLSAILIPLSRVYDSFTAVNMMRHYTDSATALYGIYTGGAEAVTGVPVAICYGIAAATLPTVSAGKRSGDHFKKIWRSLGVTILVSSLSAALMAAFATPFVNIFYGRLSIEERAITVRLITYSGASVILLSLTQTAASCLIAIGKNFVPCICLFSGVAAKAIIQPILLLNPEINIFALLISDICCYFVAVFGDLLYIIICKRNISVKKSGDTDGEGYGDNSRRHRFKRRSTDLGGI
ncbi:MAG: polysaccharide biosynthesis protein [Clostridia bacterium]|nr:polysaccharide biosynthesis protein [Clostridia bacterium]